MRNIWCDNWVWTRGMDIINRCELSNRRNNHIRAIFLEIAIKSNEYPDFRARSNRDKFDCEDSYIYLLCFFMRYFDYKDIKRRRVYRKNDLIEFFVYDNLINLQNISFDQEINDDFFDDLKFGRETQNFDFRNIFWDDDSIWKIHQ